MTAGRTKLPEAGREFFEVLGRCIAVWATVDDELFKIFWSCLGSCPHEQSAIIFYRTPGLDVRLKLTDEIIKSVLPCRPAKSGSHNHPSVKAWTAIFGKFEPLFAVRRRLAHQPVESRWSLHETVAPTDGPLNKPIPIDVHLEVRVGKHERKRQKATAPLAIVDLRQHLSAVRALANEINEFNRDVLAPQLEELLRTKGE